MGRTRQQLRPTPCRSCGTAMIWAESRSGKPMPLDAHPAPNGNVLLLDGVAHVLAIDEADMLRRRQIPLYLSHHATCPHGAKWRKR